MNGMDRAGRVVQFTRILMQQSARKSDPWMTTGMVCRRAGLKSSTHFKKMLFEMAMGIDCIMWREDRGKREYAYVLPVQLPLPDRVITINGRQHKVASWVIGRKVTVLSENGI